MTEQSQGTPDAPTPPDGTGTPPYANNSNVKDGDLRILTYVGVIAMSVLIFFGASLYLSGLLTFPAVPQDAANRDYYNDTLVYRERRMALALLMRTFLTGFSFVVGLALCTMGGLFILRQVTSLTSLSGTMGSGLGAQVISSGDATPKETAENLRKTQFSFASYSPGVLFMLGGVVIMAVTQVLAIPVRAVEIIPPGIASVCQDPENGNFKTCGESVQITLPSDADNASLAQPNYAFGWSSTDTGSAADDLLAQAAGGVRTSQTFATSDAMETSIDDTATMEIRADQFDTLALPEGYDLTGVTASHIIVAGPDGQLYVPVDSLDFDLPDWGIVGSR